MGILRFLFTILLCFAATFLVPDEVSKEIVTAVKDGVDFTVSMARDLDEKYGLLQQGSKNVATVMENPSSQNAKVILATGLFSYIVGYQVGGPLVGLLFVFGSTCIDIQQGIASDFGQSVGELFTLTWARIKKFVEQFRV